MKSHRIITTIALVFLAIGVLSSEASVYFVTGNTLYGNYLEYKKCRASQRHDAIAAGYFMGYVAAIADAWSGIMFEFPLIKQEQLFDIVGKYLENHPELRHKVASLLCFMALEEAFHKKANDG